MKKFHFTGHSRLASPALTPTLAPKFHRLCGHLQHGSVLILLLLAVLSNESIKNIQANNATEEMAEFRQVSEAARQSLEEECKPDSAEKTERLKALDAELGEEVARFQARYK